MIQPKEKLKISHLRYHYYQATRQNPAAETDNFLYFISEPLMTS